MAEQEDHRSGITLGQNEDITGLSTSLTNLKLRNSNFSTIAMNQDCKVYIGSQCERFEQYSAFVGYAKDAPGASADAVRKTVSEIDQIMMNAERGIQQSMSRLRREVDRFAEDVARFSSERWYRKVEDLTVFEGSEITEMLRYMPIDDVADFVEYLKDTLPAACKKPRPEHEYYECSFIRKVRMLLERVLYSGKYSVTFSLYANMKARVFLLERSRVPPRQLEHGVAYLDDKMLELMKLHTQAADPDDWWDFASTWRLLVNSWEDMASDAGPLLRLLGPIREKAETEIRYRTDIAVNGKLPQELADLVVEQAMAVEEVPLEAE